MPNESVGRADLLAEIRKVGGNVQKIASPNKKVVVNEVKPDLMSDLAKK